MIDKESVRALIREARIDVRDADRCVSMDLNPSAGTLHRRLREVTDTLEALYLDMPEPR